MESTFVSPRCAAATKIPLLPTSAHCAPCIRISAISTHTLNSPFQGSETFRSCTLETTEAVTQTILEYLTKLLTKNETMIF